MIAVLAAVMAGKVRMVSASSPTLLPALATMTWTVLQMAGSTKMVPASTPNTTMIAVLAAVMAGKVKMVPASTPTLLPALHPVALQVVLPLVVLPLVVLPLVVLPLALLAVVPLTTPHSQVAPPTLRAQCAPLARCLSLPRAACPCELIPHLPLPRIRYHHNKTTST